MQFTRLVLRDYGIYGGTADIDLRPEPDRPVILFGGRNGAGKTTLFESILVCLYGEGCMRMIRTTSTTAGGGGGSGRRNYERLLASRLHRDASGGTAASASVTVRFAAFVGGEGAEYEVCRSWSGDGSKKKIREELSVGRRPLATDSAGDGRFEPVDMSARWQSFITDMAPPAVAGLFFFDGERISGIARQYRGYAGDAFRSALGLDVVERLQADLVANAAREEEEEAKDGGADGRRKGRRGRTKYAELEAERARHERERRRLADLLDQKGAETAELRAEVSAAEQKVASFQGGGQPDVQLTQAELEKEDAGRRILEACSLCDTPLRLLPRDLLAGVRSWLEGCCDGASREFGAGVLQAVRTAVESDPVITGRARRRVLEILDAEAAPCKRDAKYKNDTGGAPPPPGLVSAARALRTLESAARTDNALTEACSGLTALRTRITELQAARDISESGRSERQEAARELAALASKLGSLQADARRLEADMRAAAQKARSANSRMRDLLKRARRRGGSARKAELRARVLDVLDAFHKRMQSARTRRLEDSLLQNMRILMHKDGGIQRVEVDAENGFAIQLYGAAEDAGDVGAGTDPASCLSEGERQIFALSVVWALAQVSGRPLPFVIDTPLARLDARHRSAMTREFLPGCSHQAIVLSTDSEITREAYAELAPRIARSYVLEYAGGRAACRPGYFWDSKEGEAA